VIVTVKLAVLELPLQSVATQVTLLVPTLNLLPLAGVQTSVVVQFVQLSLAVATQVTLFLLQDPVSALNVTPLVG